MIRIVLAAFVLSLIACDEAASVGSSSGSSSASRTTEPPAAVLPVPKASEVPSNARTTVPAAEEHPAECSPPLSVAPRTLAVEWPKFIGQRVSFTCRPIRRVEFVRTIIVADGVRFIVTGAPNTTPCSANRTSTFTVLGSTTVATFGRTIFTELLLEEDGGCSR